MQWNLARFAETLLPLIDSDEHAAVERATTAVHAVAQRFAAHWLDGHRRKLGLTLAEDADDALVRDFLSVMHAEAADFTNTYRQLAAVRDGTATLPAAFEPWLIAWQARLGREPGDKQSQVASMRAANPAFIPRNHRVEEVIQAAVERNDFAPFHALHAVLTRPYDDQPAAVQYQAPALPHERVEKTFCGT